MNNPEVFCFSHYAIINSNKTIGNGQGNDYGQIDDPKKLKRGKLEIQILLDTGMSELCL